MSAAGEVVTFKRGSLEKEVTAVPSHTMFEVVETSGGVIEVRSDDFILAPGFIDDLEEGDRMPMAGDVIIRANGDRFETMRGPGGHYWVWGDGRQTQIRVYTKRRGPSEPSE
ncbi:hypothetical protein LOC71_22325 [Rhodopirellula sp. JC740]|uniref:Phage head-tail joining protein domain-containing protein n=1 Tax=Rhodopirellula halodulae TaxID=2894198 RepID=A0ABS8NN61_9BACT|nr:hypothetical protein [Rhodopirellula sp. JC740]MCC9645023.1 hypothetical protein [Rhodopirellula sp. JC740]